nr:phage tail protein [Marine bacteriophage MC1]
MAIEINFIVDQGSKFTGVIDVRNEDCSPFDLTGYTAYSQMRKSYYTNTYYDIEASVEGDPVNGEIRITINPSVTENIRAGRYVYDVEVHSGTDLEDKKRVVQGIITITPQVTR